MEYRTPQAAIDVVMAQPTTHDLPPGFDGVEPGIPERHISKGEAIAILARLAAERTRTVDEVTALEMGARLLLCRAFQKQRNWARRRGRQQAYNSKAAEPLSPEAELAATVARQRGDMCHED